MFLRLGREFIDVLKGPEHKIEIMVERIKRYGISEYRKK